MVQRISFVTIGVLLLSTSVSCGDDGTSSTGSSGGTGGTGAGSTGGVGAGGQSTGGSSTGGAGGAGGEGAGPVTCTALDLSGPSQAVPLPNGCTGPACTSIGATALNDLAGGEYQGVPGGLYCNTNERPPAYEEQGVALAESIVPLDASGAPDANGQYALVSIGMSNTTQEFSAFIGKYGNDAALHPRLVLVDGAMGGQATPQWLDGNSAAWANLTQRLAMAGVTDEQVVALWVKLAQQNPQMQCSGFGGDPCFPAHADKLATDVRTILGMLDARFPNLRLIYMSSRIYAGYATSPLNPEPYAYHSGFSVKKLVLEKILDEPAASALPYLAWGPYLWADGTNANGDGLSWTVSELQNDGTHRSASGQEKVADLLFSFFTTDTTAAPWFTGP